MTFKIEFRTGNAAFATDPAEDGLISGRAVADVLRQVAGRISDFSLLAPSGGVVKDDISGTVIGTWAVDKEGA